MSDEQLPTDLQIASSAPVQDEAKATSDVQVVFKEGCFVVEGHLKRTSDLHLFKELFFNLFAENYSLDFCQKGEELNFDITQINPSQMPEAIKIYMQDAPAVTSAFISYCLKLVNKAGFKVILGVNDDLFKSFESFNLIDTLNVIQADSVECFVKEASSLLPVVK